MRSGYRSAMLHEHKGRVGVGGSGGALDTCPCSSSRGKKRKNIHENDLIPGEEVKNAPPSQNGK